MTDGMLNVSSFAEALREKTLAEIEGICIVEGSSELDDIFSMQYQMSTVLDCLSGYDLD